MSGAARSGPTRGARQGDQIGLHGLTLSCIAAAALTFASGAGADDSVAFGPAKNSLTFVDPPGDSGGGSADVTSVRASNDDAGNVTFDLVIANRTDLGDGDFVSIHLDVDRNVSTGCNLGPLGADWSLGLRGRNAPDLDNDPIIIGPFDSACEAPEPDERLFDAVKGSFDPPTSTLSLRVNRTHLRNPTSITFVIVVTIDSGEPFAPINIGDWDIAPDRGGWAYDIRVSPTKPPGPRRDQTPPRVRALASTGAVGGMAKLRYTVFDGSGKAREDITILDGGRVAATTRTKLGARRVTAVQTLSWRVPPALRGRLRFCVVARDAAGNRSAKSCAPLTIR